MTSTGPMVPTPHRVVSAHRELDDTVTIELVPIEGEIPRSRPGQFNMLWPFGVGEVAISICNLVDEQAGEGSDAPSGPATIRHTIRDVGSVTSALCALAPGDVVGVRGPFGSDWDLDSARGHDLAIVAGGIGLAPVRPVLAEVIAHRADFGRVALFVGARSPDLLLYREELETWRGRLDLDVEVTVDSAPPGWHGDVGPVTGLLSRIPLDWPGAVAFVCGPEIMMRVAAKRLVEMGVPAASVRVSLERNMKCAVVHCGHCQLGEIFVCREGPVLSYERVAPLLAGRER